MWTRVAVLCAASFAPSICLSQPEEEDAENIDEPTSTTLNEVLVTGEYPGPGLWKVTREDNGHVLWVVGQPPLKPVGITWRSHRIEEVAAQSQLIVADSNLGIFPDGKVGIFRILWLAPSVLGARKNPNGERLEELVPADIYARWLEQKARVLGRDRGIEQLRPMFAADKLEEEAIKLYLGKPATNDPSASLWSTLRRIAKDHNIQFAFPSVNIKIPPKDLGPAVKRFSKHSLDDVECFARTVAFVEALADVESVNLRAKAWAVGDLETLRRTTPLPDVRTACHAALVSSEAVAPYEVGNIAERLRTVWLDKVEEGLAANASTLALLPVDELLRTDGRLADLRAKGYLVEEP